MFRPTLTALLAVTLIGLSGGSAATQVDEDVAVRAVLDSYLATVTHPDPKPIDAEIFAADIEAFWSTGKTYLGRKAFAEALADGIAATEADFVSFQAAATDVKIRRKGDGAWLTCGIELGGDLTQERGAVRYTVRSTFVFEKRDDRWVMVHEHSSRPPARK